jgi:hypothetical protein
LIYATSHFVNNDFWSIKLHWLCFRSDYIDLRKLVLKLVNVKPLRQWRNIIISCAVNSWHIRCGLIVHFLSLAILSIHILYHHLLIPFPSFVNIVQYCLIWQNVHFIWLIHRCKPVLLIRIRIVPHLHWTWSFRHLRDPALYRLPMFLLFVLRILKLVCIVIVRFFHWVKCHIHLRTLTWTRLRSFLIWFAQILLHVVIDLYSSIFIQNLIIIWFDFW